MKNQSENETKKIENDKINVMGRNVTRGWAGRGGREGGRNCAGVTDHFTVKVS